MNVIFITGCGRSGTTILETILNGHPLIAEWYEPYYLWESYFDASAGDLWPAGQFTEAKAAVIRREFRIFARKARKPWVLDKSPYHVFNIPLIHRIFPAAKWIHILRDGRDATLSLHREWEKRRAMVRDTNIRAMAATAFEMLGRQPFWRYRLWAVAHELALGPSLDPRRYLNKRRWQGQVGYGPRFDGWRQFRRSHSELAFNAMQWAASVHAVRQHFALLPAANRCEIRYEDLLVAPRPTLEKVFAMLGMAVADGFYRRMPALNSGNVHKWRTGLTRAQQRQIRPILSDLLEQLGYAQEPW